VENLPLLTGDGWADLFADAQSELLHIETRDRYWIDHEDSHFAAWREKGGPATFDDGGWAQLTRQAADRCVKIKRLRIISTPPSEYIRFEHATTWTNLEWGGEEVRWIDRGALSEALVPGNDFWIRDGKYVMFNLFDGDGRSTFIHESTDLDLIKDLSSAFWAIWDQSVDHSEFHL